MSFDITEKKKELAVEDDGVTFHVLGADDEPAFADEEGKTPVTWTVCGLNSEQYAKAEAWQTKALRAFRGRELTAQERRENYAEFLARCSKGCTGFTDKGEPLPFTTENATAAILALPYLRRQIESRMGDHAGFTKRASAS